MRRTLLHLFFAAVAFGTSGCAGGRSGTPAALRIYVARHGQTDWNLERRLQGWTDTHLNETGRQQAQRLSERLQGVRLMRVYSSTLARSRETAELVHAGCPIESLDGLREQRIGKFEGLRLNADSLGAREFERRSADPQDALDGGESEDEFFARVSATVRSIVARHTAGGDVLIVGHGGTNQMILRTLLGLGRDQAEAIRQANDEIYMIEVVPGATPRLWKAIGTANLTDL